MQHTSLLVAALLMLRYPCTRNKLAASILLNRAAQDTALSPADREACLCLVDELESGVLPFADAPSGHKTQHSHRWPFANTINGAMFC